jgi:hypothetical protein
MGADGVGGVENGQDVDATTMMFPSEFLIDYVRVYQRKGYTNVGCDRRITRLRIILMRILLRMGVSVGLLLFLGGRGC